MTIVRLKVLRKQEERIKKVKDMLDMYSIKVPSISYPTYKYQPIGASSVVVDPRIQAAKGLFQMFHLAR